MPARASLSSRGRGLVDVWTGLGLTPSEIGAYNVLVDSGAQTASALSKATGQSRGRTYLLLRGLVERGYVREEPGTPNRFFAVSPREVLELAAKAAMRHAQELESIASEIPAPTPAPSPTERSTAGVTASLLRGRRAVAAETLRILDRSSARFYLAGAGLLAHRLKEWDAVLRALRVKASRGVSVAVAVPPRGPSSPVDALPDLGPALVAPLTSPDAFPVNLIVGDGEALLVVTDPEDASPTRGDDYAVHLRGRPYADAFAAWFERVALGGGQRAAGILENIVQARQAISDAVHGAKREVIVMGASGWLKLVFSPPNSSTGAAAPTKRGVALRLIAEADPSSWRLVKPLVVDWDVRLVRTVPVWAMVVDGALTFTGIPGDEREQVASIRRRDDHAEARQFLALFADLWKVGAPVGGIARSSGLL